jgi:hypothetical protein
VSTPGFKPLLSFSQLVHPTPRISSATGEPPSTFSAHQTRDAARGVRGGIHTIIDASAARPEEDSYVIACIQTVIMAPRGGRKLPPCHNSLTTALLTDTYQITMAYAYWKNGTHARAAGGGWHSSGLALFTTTLRASKHIHSMTAGLVHVTTLTPPESAATTLVTHTD